MNLRQKIEAGHFVLTAEVTPPVSFSADDLLAKALPLKGLADAVNVTDAAGARSAMSALAAAAILQGQGIETILQLTCRDRNRIALQGDLIGAAAVGVGNLLILRGDDPGAGDQPDAKGVFDLDPRQVLELTRKMRDAGELPTGRKIAGRASFFLGGADNPIDPPPDWRPKSLEAKIAAGAQFVQTQFCMDPGVIRRYVAKLTEHSVLDQVHILIGIAPLRSAKSARWIREKLFGAIVPEATIARLETARDQAAEGSKIALELIEEISAIRGIAGVHVMAPNNEGAIPAVLKAAREQVGRMAPT
ncbi:MAG: methylenetetrahydrofolate reductase [Pseudolabrys sp.]|nr:methylenetetrahydrofolate reductase [Pseudolabrys sp.]